MKRNTKPSKLPGFRRRKVRAHLAANGLTEDQYRVLRRARESYPEPIDTKLRGKMDPAFDGIDVSSACFALVEKGMVKTVKNGYVYVRGLEAPEPEPEPEPVIEEPEAVVPSPQADGPPQESMSALDKVLAVAEAVGVGEDVQEALDEAFDG